MGQRERLSIFVKSWQELTKSRYSIEKKLSHVYKHEPGGWTTDHFLGWREQDRNELAGGHERRTETQDHGEHLQERESYQMYFDWASKLHQTALHVFSEKLSADNQRWGNLDGIKITQVKNMINGYTTR